VVHLAVDHLRRHAMFRPGYTGTPSETLLSPTPAPEAVISAKEQLHIMRQAIIELPPNPHSQ
jgi:hypothetical protein